MTGLQLSPLGAGVNAEKPVVTVAGYWMQKIRFKAFGNFI
jgi:hypothetical protein